MSDKPNILFIITDQQRADSLGIAGHPCLLTPQMDELAAQGVRFTSAYTTSPSCVPARRCMLSGMQQAQNAEYIEKGEWFYKETLPKILRDNGYQTGLVGKPMQQQTPRKRFGYEQMVTYGNKMSYEKDKQTDYQVDCLNPVFPDASFGYGSGVGPNDRTVRTWDMDESMHPVTWTATQAKRFLRRKDPSRPWFLTVSFIAPHPPATPPDFYFQRYLRSEIPEPVFSNWANEPKANKGAPLDSPNAKVEGEELRAYRAAYYASINHIDDQLRRVIQDKAIDKENTIIVFVSDHGDMLGDHYMTRKGRPYEASARIPFFIRPHDSMDSAVRGKTSGIPTCHEDIMPTLLDIIDIDCPDNLYGKSLKSSLTGKKQENWREGIHIEHVSPESGFYHAITDGKQKLIWFYETDQKQFFDLEKDPSELHDLIESKEYESRIEYWQEKLIEVISSRKE